MHKLIVPLLVAMALGCGGPDSTNRANTGAGAPAKAPTGASPAKGTEAPAAKAPAKAGPKAAEAAKLVLWHSYRATERKALEKLVAKYNDSHPGVKVETLFIPYDAFADKITAAIPRGVGPDMFIFAHDRVGDWARAKVIEPIEFYVGTDEALLGRFFPVTVESLTYEKSLYGLPMAFKSVALFYNKKLVPNPPKTTDELVAMAKKVTDQAKKTYGLVYENANFYHHAAWLYGFGGKVFDDQGNLALDTPEAVKSFEFARDLRKVHGIVPEDVSSILVTSLFNEGRAAMVINGPWFLGEIDPKIDYGVAVLPRISPAGNAPARPFLTSEAIIMSSKSKHKKQAFEFMKYLTSDEAALVRALEGRQSVANQKVYSNPKVAADPILRVFMEQMKTAVPMPNTPEMLSVWTPATTALSSVIKGGASPAEALAKAQKEILFRLHPGAGK